MRSALREQAKGLGLHPLLQVLVTVMLRATVGRQPLPLTAVHGASLILTTAAPHDALESQQAQPETATSPGYMGGSNLEACMHAPHQALHARNAAVDCSKRCREKGFGAGVTHYARAVGQAQLQAGALLGLVRALPGHARARRGRRRRGFAGRGAGCRGAGGGGFIAGCALTADRAALSTAQRRLASLYTAQPRFCCVPENSA